jgi:hypothetical protein
VTTCDIKARTPDLLQIGNTMNIAAGFGQPVPMASFSSGATLDVRGERRMSHRGRQGPRRRGRSVRPALAARRADCRFLGTGWRLALDGGAEGQKQTLGA